jgi:predicted DNA-binding transcriptional regulator AlpA
MKTPAADQTRLMTDQELCDFLRISRATLKKHLAGGPPRKRNRTAADVRLIRHVKIGGTRRWLRASVEAFVQ